MIESIPAWLLVPTLTLVRKDSAKCTCAVDLAIPSVADEDTTVDLIGRWFIDYDPKVRATWTPRKTDTLSGSFDFSRTVRPGPSYRVTADDLGADGIHIVDVVLAEEGAFNEDNNSVEAPGRTVFKEYESAAYRFVVEVVTDDAIQQCPQQPPFARLCTGP